MRSAKRVLWAVFFLLPFLFSVPNAYGALIDDYTPEVTARVARISFIRGEVQIRRGENKDWERATLNLPLVEGDELATEAGARVEIQFDAYNHLRLAENSYLKLTTFGEEGVAVSLPQGILSLRLQDFDKSKSYFEIDAPETTVSIERSGIYRVDAGEAESPQIHVTATEGGEARVYTKTSGFTLRDGRTAKIIIEGSYAGDYEMNAAARSADEFDAWVLERDAIIAKRLKDAYYDKYYDRDMYGAEDLNEHGEWINTRKYGWVWKPYPASVRGYANWSPYRYGHWRWIPVYGWTWVNDEPWGWATYHHGRWVYDDGFWVWTPYPQYRWRRSWWRPALITIVTWNGSTICWYPLSYDDYYVDYNSNYYRRSRRIYNNTTIINNNTTVVVNPTPNPSPNASPTPQVIQNPTNADRRNRLKTPSLQRLPPGAVVAVDTSEFGRQTKGYRTLPTETARKILTADTGQTPPILPTLPDLNGKISKDILIPNPRRRNEDSPVKTGATERKTKEPLDEALRQKMIYGNRQPVQSDENPVVKRGLSGRPDNNSSRKTGTVSRPVTKQEEPTQGETPPIMPRSDYPTRNTGGGNRDDDDDNQKRNERKPVYRPKQSEDNQTPPIFVPPPQPKQKEERREEPRQKEERREQPNFPPRQEQPKQREEPRREEPRREQPRPQPPPKSEPKSEPKSNPQPERKVQPEVNRKTKES